MANDYEICIDDSLAIVYILHDYRESIKISLEDDSMIESFGDPATEDLFHNRRTRRARSFPPEIIGTALRKLDVLDNAHRLQDLRVPPGNRLEGLKGNLRGFHSIRVNEQWRIIFRWAESSARQVTLTDYH